MKRSNDRFGARGRRWTVAAATALLFTGTMVGCSDDDTTGPGDDDGDVEAFVVDDPNGASPSVADRTSLNAAIAAAITGTASGDARVDISTDGTQWIQLGSTSSLDVALQSTTEESVGEASVPVGTYTMVRLVLDGASADVLAGSTIGGIALGADVTVMVAGGNQVILERAVQFNVSADTKVRIVFDLNSEQWITQSAITAGTATEAAVDASVTAGASLTTS